MITCFECEKPILNRHSWSHDATKGRDYHLDCRFKKKKKEVTKKKKARAKKGKKDKRVGKGQGKAKS